MFKIRFPLLLTYKIFEHETIPVCTRYFYSVVMTRSGISQAKSGDLQKNKTASPFFSTQKNKF